VFEATGLYFVESSLKLLKQYVSLFDELRPLLALSSGLAILQDRRNERETLSYDYKVAHLVSILPGNKEAVNRIILK